MKLILVYIFEHKIIKKVKLVNYNKNKIFYVFILFRLLKRKLSILFLLDFYTTILLLIEKICLIIYIFDLIHANTYLSYSHILMYDNNIKIKSYATVVIRIIKN